ncbi:UbiH/UbiF family hydroxylase [Terrihabitans rhizophilus]|uniref:UbiH/UbiF family hydroxylase n=1 Tax=Terrihabitans rhizophilus TaxID=3092662 RepID=A0ABU4RKI5_9HYPH|nr:UbiH/UbiF family hydroxylase [Terrihabitans sp. PJ23]MDX6805337.1 UbiH/UbiF family hydroxylase [Terrihabitans sp. PJ23]
MDSDLAADVIVVGGGPTGLLTAALLAHGGVRVALVAPPAPDDNRTTALMHGSLQILERLQLWPLLSRQTGVLRRLRIVDASDNLIRAPEVVFEAADVGLSAFGHNIENKALTAALRGYADAMPTLRLYTSNAQSVHPDEAGVVVRLEDGTELGAPLLVGADGRGSISRAAAGISARTRRYDQAAMTLNISHTRSHEDVSTEFHRSGGPFTVVPLPGNRSSVVYVARPDQVARLEGLAAGDLQHVLERESFGLLGRITIDSKPSCRPLASLRASSFAARRIALVGEAAHVLPPIGAQGLNLGFRDAAGLADLIIPAVMSGADPGDVALLGRYARQRQLDVEPRSIASDLLNRSLLTRSLPVQALRAGGLAALSRIAPVRRALVRQGLALESAKPV